MSRNHCYFSDGTEKALISKGFRIESVSADPWVKRKCLFSTRNMLAMYILTYYLLVIFLSALLLLMFYKTTILYIRSAVTGVQLQTIVRMTGYIGNNRNK